MYELSAYCSFETEREKDTLGLVIGKNVVKDCVRAVLIHTTSNHFYSDSKVQFQILIQPRLRRRSDRVVAAAASSASSTPAQAASVEGSAPSSPAPSSTAEGDMEDEKALKKSLLVLWNDIDQHRFANNFHKPPANSDDVLK